MTLSVWWETKRGEKQKDMQNGQKSRKKHRSRSRLTIMIILLQHILHTVVSNMQRATAYRQKRRHRKKFYQIKEEMEKAYIPAHM